MMCFFVNNFKKVVDEILHYRNAEIEKCIMSVLDQFPNKDVLKTNTPFTL